MNSNELAKIREASATMHGVLIEVLKCWSPACWGWCSVVGYSTGDAMRMQISKNDRLHIENENHGYWSETVGIAVGRDENDTVNTILCCCVMHTTIEVKSRFHDRSRAFCNLHIFHTKLTEIFFRLGEVGRGRGFESLNPPPPPWIRPCHHLPS